jgi:MerR family transcriptional regulator, copper efflux regulator
MTIATLKSPAKRDAGTQKPAQFTGTLSPAQLIALTGTSRGILRVYERSGLIEPIERAANGYRRYAALAVDQLKAIRTAKELGFTLAEIGDMLGLGAPGMTKAQVRTIAQQRVKMLDGRIAQLKVLRDCFAAFVANPSQAFDPECDLLLSFATAGNDRAGTRAHKGNDR